MMDWNKEEATVRQKWYIEDHGGTWREGMTKQEAHEEIVKINKGYYKEQKERERLKKYNYLPDDFNPFGGMD